MGNKLKSSILSFAPIVILTIIAMTQLGRYSYTKLGGMIVLAQAAYVALLIPAIIVLLVLRKRGIASGLAITFGIGFFVTLVVLGMGL